MSFDNQTPSYIVLPGAAELAGTREGETWTAATDAHPWVQDNEPAVPVISPGLLEFLSMP